MKANLAEIEKLLLQDIQEAVHTDQRAVAVATYQKYCSALVDRLVAKEDLEKV